MQASSVAWDMRLNARLPTNFVCPALQDAQTEMVCFVCCMHKGEHGLHCSSDAGHASLQMSISKHAARQLPESKTKTESTALVVPPPPQTSQSWPSKNRHLQAAPLLQQGASASRRQPQAITCMLERLQLLQQEGVHFAGFL